MVIMVKINTRLNINGSINFVYFIEYLINTILWGQLMSEDIILPDNTRNQPLGIQGVDTYFAEVGLFPLLNSRSTRSTGSERWQAR
jgi:hypothetical protein